MRVMELVERECANWQRGGSCMGVVMGENCMPVRCEAKSECLVGKGEECEEFEGCVLAGIVWIRDEKKRKEWEEAAGEYEGRKLELADGGKRKMRGGKKDE